MRDGEDHMELEKFKIDLACMIFFSRFRMWEGTCRRCSRMGRGVHAWYLEADHNMR